MGWIGYGRYLQFNQIYVSSENTYRLKISYLTGEKRTLKLNVNGVYTIEKILSGTSTSMPTIDYVDILLEQGNNTIKFFNDDGWAPDIDYIEIVSVEAPEILITNINNRETITYPYLILKGEVCNYTENIISISVNNEEALSWMIHPTKKIFKAVVKLIEGMNIISIKYNLHKPKCIIVQYIAKKDGPSVRFIYATPSDDLDGRFRAPDGMDNGLNAAKARYSLQAYLVQSIFAELMYDRGFGRQTFRILLPDEDENCIFIHTLSKSFDEMMMYNSVNNHYPDSGYTANDLYYIYNDITSLRNVMCIKDVVMTSCSRIEPHPITPDCEDGYETFSSTALGAENMVLVDSTKLYLMPESINGLCNAMYDRTLGISPDKERWKYIGISFGGLIHELGHMFGLDHYYENGFIDWETGELAPNGDNGRNGIMGYGFYEMSHIFTVREANGTEFDSETDNVCWNWAFLRKHERLGVLYDEQNDGSVLSSNSWISDKPYNKREAESPENRFTSSGSGNDLVRPTIENRTFCSGRKYVGDLGCGNSIEFNNIYVEQSGYYNIDVYYFSGEQRYIYLSTNSSPDLGRLISFPKLKDWNTLGKYTISCVYLNSGINDIYFKTDNIPSTWGPDIDKIEIWIDHI